MAFLGKVGNMLRQAARVQVNTHVSAFKPSIYQAIRCMSSSKLFVGGISYGTDEQSLREAFDKYGQVVEARVIVDRETGRSRGFGFVTYTSSEEASSAIQALDGQDLHGRRVKVNYATDRARGFGSGGGFGGDYGAPGGNYGGSAGNYGSNPYGSGGDSFGNPGSYGRNYGDSGAGGYGGGDFASRDTYASGNGNYGGENQFGSSNQFSGEFGGSNEQFGNAGNSSMEDGPEGHAQDDSMSGDWKEGDDNGVAKQA